jgi:hypothetical protein
MKIIHGNLQPKNHILMIWLLALAGSRGLRNKAAGLMAGSRVDSQEIRGLCFL